MSTSLKAVLLVTLLVGVHLKSATINLTKDIKAKKTTEDGFLSNDSDDLPLGNFQNASYYGNVGFGKDAATGEINYIPVIFDTGSSWLWSATTGCACDAPQSGKYFNVQDSDFKSSGHDTTLNYGSGSAAGPVGTMTICLNEELCYDDQTIVAATSDSQMNGYASGIFGLSHKAGANNTPTLIDNLYDSGKLDERVFTVELRNENAQSSITIGKTSYENVKPGSTFSYANLLSGPEYSWYYTFNIEKVKLGSSVASNHLAIADTGTSLLCIPPSIADPFFQDSAFDGCEQTEGIYVCECSARDQFPNLEFTINGTTFDVTPEQYILPNEGNTCVVGIETFTPQGGLIVLGDVFLRTVVAVFDLQNESVGFAPATYA